MMAHLESNKILAVEKHGFRKGISCETQLLSLSEDWNSRQQKNLEQTDFIIIDFTKAFDNVNPSLLVKNLEHYGINGWVKS